MTSISGPLSVLAAPAKKSGSQEFQIGPLTRPPIRKHDDLRAGRAFDNLDNVGRVAALGEPSRLVGYVFPVAVGSRHAVVADFKALVIGHGE